MTKPKLIFSDFDGTLTLGPDLTPRFFELLNLLNSRSLPLVIVTGRSVSWAHFLLTHFSFLDFVIAEGGGVIVKRGKGADLVNEFLVEELLLDKLQTFSIKLLEEFKEIKLSADSIGRCSDRAIELCEFSGNRNHGLKNRVEAFMENNHINHSTSSVHLNFWSGEISKYRAAGITLERYFEKLDLDDCLFFGDSLNDQSMFQNLSNSVGVSNIESCIERMQYRPKVILEGEENNGIDGVFNYLVELLK